MNFESNETNPVIFGNGESGSDAGILAEMMAQAPINAPRPTDDHLPRYGASFLLAIPLYIQHGNNFFGDYNQKDSRTGANIQNRNYYPAFELMPFFGGTTNIPFEPEMIESDDRPEPAAFDIAAFTRSRPKIVSTVTKSARQCVDTATRLFRARGFVEFFSLVGFHETDDDKGLRAAARLYNLVLPLRDPQIFAVGEQFVRTRMGVSFSGPFLDQMVKFLKYESLKRINDSGLQGNALEVAKNLHAEIRAGVERGSKMASTIINQTHAEMKNPKGLKKAYDEPDLLTYDAPVATDLYCLAHLNQAELDNQQLEASGNIGEKIADGMKDALKETFAQFMPVPVQSAGTEAGLTAEEARLELDREREEFREEMRREREEFMREITLNREASEQMMAKFSAQAETATTVENTNTEPKENKTAANKKAKTAE